MTGIKDHEREREHETDMDLKILMERQRGIQQEILDQEEAKCREKISRQVVVGGEPFNTLTYKTNKL